MAERKGKFLVYVDKKGEYRFTLKASNGEPIGLSEGYSSKAACLNGVEAVRKHSAKAEIVNEGEGKCPKFEVYKDKAGEFRFRLIASNGEPILASEGYSVKASAIGGCEAVIRYSADAVLEEKEKE